MLGFKVVPVTPFAQNCTVVWCEQSKLAAVVDPGGELEKILGVIDQNNLTLDKILITHAHLDHAGGTAELAGKSNVAIIGPHRDDQFWIDLLPEQCRQFGFEGEVFTPDQWLTGDETIPLGELEFAVVHCPGHTPGHVVFVELTQQFALVGDVLFQGSVGRSDFPRGDHRQLIASIKNKLLPLGDGIRFVPGHGPMSTFGQERRQNPFIVNA